MSLFDLLNEPIILVSLRDGSAQSMSLPELYGAMAEDEVLGFPSLRLHQTHAWHAFLAQLGTIAMHRANQEKPVKGAEEWLLALAALSEGENFDQAWHLICDEPKKPAFMQPANPKGMADFKKIIATPDSLDVLITSKNHDVKQDIMHKNNLNDWLFALISLQTTAAVLGAGNYGIARMNGGFSSRPCVGLFPADAAFGGCVFSDMERMLAYRSKIFQKYEFYRQNDGVALIWLLDWAGTSSLQVDELDPYFIEIARRVRLYHENERIFAKTAPSKCTRIDAKAQKGDLGDFWTPHKQGKALSISKSTFNYDKFARLVFSVEDFDPPPALREFVDNAKKWNVVARGLAGGQGKTEGYYERGEFAFFVKKGMASRFMSLDQKEMEQLAKLVNEQINEIARAKSILKTAIAIAASGGKAANDLSDDHRKYANPYLLRLENWADQIFFQYLECRFRAGNREERQLQKLEFCKALIKQSSTLFYTAYELLHRNKPKAVSSESYFYAALRKSKEFQGCEDLFKTNREGEKDE